MLADIANHMRPYLARTLSTLALAVVAVGLIGCSGSDGVATDEAVEEMPQWMADVPEDPSYLFGTATSTSQKMQTAIDKAQTQARGEVAGQLETEFQGLTRQFEEEVGEDQDAVFLEQFTQVQQEVVSQTMTGAAPRERAVTTEDGLYRAYVLVELPIGQAAQELMSQLEQNEEAYTRFRQSQAFEELREEVERYEEEREAERREFEEENDQ